MNGQVIIGDLENGYASGSPSVKLLPDGRIITAWVEATDQVRIVAQVFDAGGQPLSDRYTVASGSDLTGPCPIIEVLSSGDVVVGWNRGIGQPLSVGSSDTDYRASILSVDGSTISEAVPEFVVYDPVYNTGRASILPTDDGGFITIVSIHSRSGDGIPNSDSFEVVGQRVDGDGMLVGDFFHVNASTWGNQREPVLVATDDGGFLAVYRTSVNGTADPYDMEIYGQLYDADNQRVGSEINFSDDSSARQVRPDAVVLDDGRILVAWADRDGTGYLGQLTDSSGALLLDQPFVINTLGSSNSNKAFSLAATDSGGFVAAWTQEETVNEVAVWNTYYQVFDGALQPTGDPVLVGGIADVNTDPVGPGQDLEVAVRGDTIVIVNEQDDPEQGVSSAIALTVIRPEGSVT